MPPRDPTGDFFGYVGDPEIHDVRVLKVERNGDRASVVVKGASGRILVVEFVGVTAIRSNRREGMVLYSLSEMKGTPPLWRFVFTNWHDEDDASLEIIAREFLVSP